MPVTIKAASAKQQSPKGGLKASPSIPIVVGVCVVLLIFVGFLGYHYFGPRTEHLTPHAAGQDESWMMQKAMETQGDFGKLSPADQQEAFRHGGGEVPQTLKMMYQTHKAAQSP